VLLVAIVVCHTTGIIGTETFKLPYSYRHRNLVGASNFYQYIDCLQRCRGILNAYGTDLTYTKGVWGIGSKQYGDGNVCAIGSTTKSASTGRDKKIATEYHGTISGCGYHIRTPVVIRAGPIHRRHVAFRVRGECSGFVLPAGVKISDRVGGDQEKKEHEKFVRFHNGKRN
jgi:hypothetical protein